MRASIRHVGILVACLSVAPAVAEGGKGKQTPAQKEADAFLATVTGLLSPVSTSAANADWAAATDVTPEHIGERTGADKTLPPCRDRSW